MAAIDEFDRHTYPLRIEQKYEDKMAKYQESPMYHPLIEYLRGEFTPATDDESAFSDDESKGGKPGEQSEQSKTSKATKATTANEDESVDRFVLVPKRQTQIARGRPHFRSTVSKSSRGLSQRGLKK